MLVSKGLYKDSGILSKLLQLVVVFLFFTLSAMSVWLLVSDQDYSNTDSLKLLQLFQSVGMFILPPLVLAYLWSEKPFSYLQLNSAPTWWDSKKIVLIMVAAIPAINLLSFFNQQLVLPDFMQGVEVWMRNAEAETALITQKFVNVKGVNALLFNIFLISIIPALGEELFFRGTIQKIFTEWKNAKLAIWLAAIIFSTIHLQFLGFLPRMLLGAFFGYLLLWSGSLWLVILAHFTNNFLAVVFYYFKFNGFRVIDLDRIGTGDTLWLGIFSCIVTIAGIILIKKSFEKKSKGFFGV